MEDKNYEVEVAPETPFPGEPIILGLQNQPSQSGNYSPSTTKEKNFPRKRTAVELLSTALNTKSRKILQEFALQDSGGFKVGDFKSGISGDLRITPNGLTARNISGITTFAIDGDTGDAVFLGQIRGGSILSDTTIEASSFDGGSININDNFTVNDDGDIVIGNILGTDISNPSLLFYNDEGTLVGKLNGDTAIVKYFRWDDVALGNTIFYEGAVTLTNEIARINVDQGLVMKGFPLRVTGTGLSGDAVVDKEAAIYLDQTGAKDKLMVKFESGAAQQIAIEP